MQPPTLQSTRSALATIADATADLAIFGSDADADALPTTGQRRRRTRRGEPDPVCRAALYLNPDGILEWDLQALEPPTHRPGRRAARPPATPEGELVDLFEYEPLGANAVGAFLEKVDLKLNPRAAGQGGLWKLQVPTAGGSPAATPAPDPQGHARRLLWVHGTFSKSQAFFDGIARAPNGDGFLQRLFANYDEVLAFEHPTLSVSPVLNALDLSRALAGIRGPLDIVAHSRGGLVTRWTLEAFGVPAERVRAVLVGSPLGGTSLASPPRLRATLGLLTNFGTVLRVAGGVASAYVPLLLAPMALLKVATAIVGTAARTPVLDGTIAMIPGLAAQSRVDNNPELTRLRRFPAHPAIDYSIVTSNFEPDSPGWKFWKWFRGKRLANAAADKVFPDANDLVVDTASMEELPAAPVGRLEFGKSVEVHHTNYFEQRRVAEFVAAELESES